VKRTYRRPQGGKSGEKPGRGKLLQQKCHNGRRGKRAQCKRKRVSVSSKEKGQSAGRKNTGGAKYVDDLHGFPRRGGCIGSHGRARTKKKREKKKDWVPRRRG